MKIRSLYFILGLCCLGSLSSAQEPGERWAKAVQAFVDLDQETPPPENAVLFTGSSTFRIWAKNLATDFAPLTVIGRGFGGSTYKDLLLYLDPLVLNPQPRAVVIYSGENDIGNGKSAEKTFEDFTAVVAEIENALPDTRLYIIGIKPAPARGERLPEMKIFNEKVEAYTATTENIRFLNLWERMLDSEGNPDLRWFAKDRIHLSKEGMALWREEIQQILFPAELPAEQRFITSLADPIFDPATDGLHWDAGEERMRIFESVAGKKGLWFQRAVEGEIPAGSPVEIRFRIRTRRPEGSEEDNQAGQGGVVVHFGAVSEDAAARNKLERIQIRSIALASADWQEIRIPFRSQKAFQKGEAVVQIARAYFDETVEIEGLSLRVYPPEIAMNLLQRSGASYPGQAADAPWRKQAENRIRELRSGPLQVKVVDAFGHPVVNAEVSIEMTRHAYLFGTCVKATRLIDADLASRREDFDQETFLADNVRYRNHLRDLFNYAVYENDMKWPQWWNEKDWADQAWTRESLDWLEQEDFEIKGHTLIWGSWQFTPERLKVLQDDPEALQTAILAHIRDVGMAVRGRVTYMDVLNEPMSHTDLIDIVGMDGVAEWFKAAREAMPGTKLVLNDFDLIGNGGSAKRRTSFLAFVKELQERGAPIDVIGFQSHFWSPKLTPPERMWEIMDEVHEATGLPLMVSEFDMNLNDEALQADYTRDFLTAWYAHPASEAYIMWGFWGGAHWMRDAGAMIRKDWTEKPNLEAYRNLVKRDWWTTTQALSKEDGTVTVPAFYGSYQITVEAPGHPVVQRQWEHHADGDTFWIQVF